MKQLESKVNELHIEGPVTDDMLIDLALLEYCKAHADRNESVKDLLRRRLDKKSK